MAIRMSLVTDSPGSRSLSSPAKHFTTYLHRPRLQWSAGLLLLLCCLVCRVSASSLDPAQPTETLVVDTRVPTKAPWPWATADQEEIKRRSLEARDNTNSTAPAATITLSIAVSATASASPLPSPLDGGLSSNFSKPSSGTNNCPTFFDDFLANPTFKQCYPFSLLLQVSYSQPQKACRHTSTDQGNDRAQRRSFRQKSPSSASRRCWTRRAQQTSPSAPRT